MVYSENYSEAASFFRIYVFIYFLYMFLRGVILRATNRTKLIFIIYLANLPVTAICGFLLIKNLGVMGAVYTALIGNSLPILMSVFLEKQIMKLSFGNWIEWNSLLNIMFCSLLPVFILLFFKQLNTSKINILFISTLVYFPLVILIEYQLNVFMFKNEFKRFKSELIKWI